MWELPLLTNTVEVAVGKYTTRAREDCCRRRKQEKQNATFLFTVLQWQYVATIQRVCCFLLDIYKYAGYLIIGVLWRKGNEWVSCTTDPRANHQQWAVRCFRFREANTGSAIVLLQTFLRVHTCVCGARREKQATGSHCWSLILVLA